MNATPIDYWSYSAMTALMRNPLHFKKRYILKVYDDISSPTGVVGKAAHAALEAFYNGAEVHDAISAGFKYIDETSDMGINYGKTGSRESIRNTFGQAMNFYFAERPTYYKILGVELSMTVEAHTIQGDPLPLPLKAVCDLITRNKYGEIEIIDHKFVAGHSTDEADNITHFIQSMFAYHAVKAHFGEAPKRMIFAECKVSKNRDDSPQIKPYIIEFNNPDDFAIFYKLYDSCTRFITRDDVIYLPNPADVFDGQNSFEIFRSGVIGVDKPMVVTHKTEQRQFAERQYVPSAFDKVENQHLSPEEKIRLKLEEFNITVEHQETHIGPSITQYTFKPSRGISMAKVAKTGADLSLALEARSLRIEAPVRGTGLIGIEVPSLERKRVDLVESHLTMGTMMIPIGVNVFGETVKKDLADMPHLLIAGATGAGKSVMLNVIIKSLTKQLKPEDLELILIDPKQVEFAPFEGLAHLAMPVVYDNKRAAEVLDETVKEMERRYETLRMAGCRSIHEYLANNPHNTMPYRVLILDEFADLMMSADKQPVSSLDYKLLQDNIHNLLYASPTGKITQKLLQEAVKTTLDQGAPHTQESIIRIAQKARAVGIHLIIATQRPSADVVTGLIKANVPTKIAFMTSSSVNSRIILDENGAEELTGKGDMLFMDPSVNGLQRLQGLYA